MADMRTSNDQWISQEDLNKLAATTLREPLPPSPCLKSLLNGNVYIWNPQFAARPELYVNCDDDGNEDEAAWRGAMAAAAAAKIAAGSPPAVGPDKAPYSLKRIPSSRDLAAQRRVAAAAPGPPAAPGAPRDVEPETEIDPALVPIV